MEPEHKMGDMKSMNNMENMKNMDMSDMKMDHQMMNHGGHMMDMGNLHRKFWLSLILMIPLLAIAPVGGFTLLTFTGAGLLQLLLGSIIFFYGGSPFFSGARGELKAHKPAMMTLIALGITVAYFYSLYATVASFLGQAVMNFWFELSTLIVIMLLGHLIEMSAVMRAGDSLHDLAALLPKKAHAYRDSQTTPVDVAVSDLQVGERLLVKENEPIPADGLLLKPALVDESMITGESRAVKKDVGAPVFGGALNQNFPFEMSVTSLGEYSYLAQVADLVQQAQAQKSDSENLADKVAGWLFYAALSVGILAFIIWTVVHGFSFALTIAVAVFVIACPHALGLAVPLVVARLTNLSAKTGLLIQNRTALEGVSKIKYALMDKTGTLTDGKFAVRQLTSFGKVTSDELLDIMASLEKNSTHPLAQAIIKAAGTTELQASEVENLPGAGISGKVLGKQYQLISQQALNAQNLSLPEDSDVHNRLQQAEKLGLSLSFLTEVTAQRTEILGFVALGDSLKPDVKAFIEGLKAQKIEPIMLTGDNAATAEKVASLLGINEFRANLKPADKEKLVREYQKQAGVLFIGDGVNDSPALASSDLGIAIGSGTSVAIHTADVVLVNSNPAAVLDLLKLAKRSNRKMLQNLWWGGWLQYSGTSHCGWRADSSVEFAH